MLARVLLRHQKTTDVDYTDDERRIFEATGDIWIATAGAVLLGVFGLLVWSYAYGALQEAHHTTTALWTFGIYSLVACAAAAAGALFGFLFGIPRTREAERVATLGDDPGSVKQAVLAANTNLERVSDWLTTLLLGATLVQLNKIVEWIGALGTNIRAHPDETVTTVVVIYFVVVGFLGTYLVTRLYLTYALQRTLLGVMPLTATPVRQQLRDALPSDDPARLDRVLKAFEREKSRPEIAADPEVNLLLARVAGKRLKLGGLDADRKKSLQADLLTAWKKALANPDVKTRMKTSDAERKELQDLDAELTTEIEKELQ
jgi:hypothetical protein